MISGARNGHLGAILKTSEYQIQAGVPADLGGDNEGPDPEQILEAALAACTILTLQMYANRKQWPLESANTVVKMTPRTPGEGADFSREITLVGNLTQEQRQRLLEIANKCPVHKILSGPIQIKTTLT